MATLDPSVDTLSVAPAARLVAHLFKAKERARTHKPELVNLCWDQSFLLKPSRKKDIPAKREKPVQESSEEEEAGGTLASRLLDRRRYIDDKDHLDGEGGVGETAGSNEISIN